MKAGQAEFLELSQELLDHGKSIRFRAHGKSMHPFIKDGDILIVEPMNGAPANVGDIIFYRLPYDILVAHRLIRVEKHKDNTILITKGDALKYHDPPIPTGLILGKIIRVEGKERQLPLKGWPGRPLGFLIACFARGHYPQQIRFVRNLGRLWWLMKGRHIQK